MKKILAVCLTIVMALSMTMSVVAAPGNFVSSPSGNSAPIIVEVELESEECTLQVIITPYIDRGELTEEAKDAIEEAYKDISDAGDLSDLVEELGEIAGDKGATVDTLAVSDLFDLSYDDCDIHDEHGGEVIVTIKPETLKNFISLVFFNGTSWEYVEDAAVMGENMDQLKFTANGYGPYAIVVDAESMSDMPETYDGMDWIPYIIVMIISAAAAIILWKKASKKEA